MKYNFYKQKNNEPKTLIKSFDNKKEALQYLFDLYKRGVSMYNYWRLISIMPRSREEVLKQLSFSYVKYDSPTSSADYRISLITEND